MFLKCYSIWKHECMDSSNNKWKNKRKLKTLHLFSVLYPIKDFYLHENTILLNGKISYTHNTGTNTHNIKTTLEYIYNKINDQTFGLIIFICSINYFLLEYWHLIENRWIYGEGSDPTAFQYFTRWKLCILVGGSYFFYAGWVREFKSSLVNQVKVHFGGVIWWLIQQAKTLSLIAVSSLSSKYCKTKRREMSKLGPIVIRQDLQNVRRSRWENVCF